MAIRIDRILNLILYNHTNKKY